MNNRVNQVFIERTHEVMLRIFGLNPYPGTPEVLKVPLHHEWDISGFIPVTGGCRGVIAVRFKEKLAHALLENARLQDIECNDSWSFINDMVGEIVNTIAGNVLTLVGGEQTYVSIPITIQGKNHLISHNPSAEVVAIPFSLPAGNFNVEYGLTWQ